MPADGRALLDLARSLAVVAHHGQCRKGTGEPYFNHVERVAESVQGWRRRTIAYLHDVLEDTGVTAEMLDAMGFPFDIRLAVVGLTRRSYESYAEFIDRVTEHEDSDVRAIKLADLRDNLRDIDILPGDTASLRRRYVLAESLLLEIEEGVV